VDTQDCGDASGFGEQTERRIVRVFEEGRRVGGDDHACFESRRASRQPVLQVQLATDVVLRVADAHLLDRLGEPQAIANHGTRSRLIQQGGGLGKPRIKRKWCR
jgi:hypothetical protein